MTLRLTNFIFNFCFIFIFCNSFAQNLTVNETLTYIKQQIQQNKLQFTNGAGYKFYLEDGLDALNKHFKPQTTYETKKSLIQILPQVAITIGVGGAAGSMMNNGEEQQTTNNRYGGSIKKLSKFIRK